jgi:hypothetical protein
MLHFSYSQHLLLQSPFKFISARNELLSIFRWIPYGNRVVNEIEIACRLFPLECKNYNMVIARIIVIPISVVCMTIGPSRPSVLWRWKHTHISPMVIAVNTTSIAGISSMKTKKWCWNISYLFNKLLKQQGAIYKVYTHMLYKYIEVCLRLCLLKNQKKI